MKEWKREGKSHIIIGKLAVMLKHFIEEQNFSLYSKSKEGFVLRIGDLIEERVSLYRRLGKEERYK